MKLNVTKTRAIFFSIKKLLFFNTNIESCVTRSDFIKYLGVLIDSNPNHPCSIERIFSRAIRLLCLMPFVTFSFSFFHSLLMLYFTSVLSNNTPQLRGIQLLQLMPVSMTAPNGSSYLLLILVFSII
jgi:hypothetical protein